MGLVISHDDQRHKNISLVGGKANSLWRLKQAGFKVPDWFVIPVDIANNYRKEGRDISSEAIAEITAKFHALIAGTDSEAVAVRSSSVSEDSAQASFAGQFETVLFVRDEEQFLSAIKKVAQSFRSAEAYAKKKGVETSLSLAVIVQAMIDADAAGVAFSRESHEVTAPVLINAALGVGTPVVNGLGNASVYTVDVLNRRLLDCEGNTLSGEQILSLAGIIKDIEKKFGEPQDIEWAIKSGIIYILQSRPITSYPKSLEKIWDNSNIAESYTGITLPLTASFARYVYAVVYCRVLRTSGISERQVFSYRRSLNNLLGFPAGRFYYNLKNWYVMLSFFPLFRHNKKFLEQMIGVPEDDTYLPPPPSKMFASWYLARTVFRIYFFSRELDGFYKAFDRYFQGYRKKKSRKLSADELEGLFDYLDRELLYRWHTPIDNDFLVMIFHGWLRKLSTKYGLLTHYEPLVNDLLTGLGGVTSADQSRQLLTIAKLVRKESKLRNIFRDRQWDILDSRVNEFPDFFEAVNEYREKFGDRFANELKLETEDLSENSAALYDLILLYTKMSEQELERKEMHRDTVRKKAEKHVAKSLSGVRKWIFKWVLKRTRYHIKHRENMRLMRAQTFGAVRFIFLGLARYLVAQGLLKNNNDIFYLEIDEVFRIIDGSATTRDLRGLVDLRRKEYDKYNNRQLPQRFATRGIPYLNLPSDPSVEATPTSILRGEACSSGIVSGTAHVMVDLKTNADLPEDAILIARHTDPGWIPTFSYVRGLIVEHGGLLSHAAIVSRELGIPCIVGVPNATKILRDGDKIRMNGDSGLITIGQKE